MFNIDISSHVQLHFLLRPFYEMPIKQVLITNCFASCNSIRFLARVENLIHKLHAPIANVPKSSISQVVMAQDFLQVLSIWSISSSKHTAITTKCSTLGPPWYEMGQANYLLIAQNVATFGGVKVLCKSRASHP